jgi:hypothetical protein
MDKRDGGHESHNAECYSENLCEVSDSGKSGKKDEEPRAV